MIATTVVFVVSASVLVLGAGVEWALTMFSCNWFWPQWAFRAGRRIFHQSRQARPCSLAVGRTMVLASGTFFRASERQILFVPTCAESRVWEIWLSVSLNPRGSITFNDDRTRLEGHVVALAPLVVGAFATLVLGGGIFVLAHPDASHGGASPASVTSSSGAPSAMPLSGRDALGRRYIRRSRSWSKTCTGSVVPPRRVRTSALMGVCDSS
jgi:hypothetical protein